MKIGIVISFFIILIILAVYPLFNSSMLPEKTPEPSEIPASTTEENFEPYTATFEIYTNGTKRIFTDPRYHNQSTEIYIESRDPMTIKVNSSGLTWADFFETLPMSLSKECLVTGTGQTFCDGENGELKFYVNETERPNAIDEEIKPGDHLRVVFD